MFERIIKENFFVTTPDGISLAVTIQRPETDLPLPCLMTYTPYRISSGLGGVDLLEFAKHGYVTLIYDVRGTGDSSGTCDSVYSDNERADGLFMIDWASKQPWCDGKVGMWGISYGAIISLQMAAESPPALKAIIARSGSDDPFAEWTNLGGVPRNYIYESFSPFMSARNFAPPSYERWGEKWMDIWQERLDANLPWGISFLENIEDSVFWRNRATRSKIENITCPVFVVEGWSDWYSNPMLRIFSRLRCPKRALIGPWGHQWPNRALPGPRINWEKEALLWWDYWLKGKDNGFIDTPALSIFVQQPTEPANFTPVSDGWFYTDENWPVSNTQVVLYHLDPESKVLQSDFPQESKKECLPYSPLAGRYSGKVGGGPFRYNVLRPLDQRFESNNSLTLTGNEVAENYLIIGNPKVSLFLSSNTEIGQISASLIDIFPNGVEALISRQFLNMSYANYPEGEVTPLTPELIYQVDVELVATAYEMRAGHRLALKLACADFQMSWPSVKPFILTLHSSPSHPSSLMVPTITSISKQIPSSIQLLKSDESPVLPDVSYEVFEDQVTAEVGYRFQSKSVFGNSGELRFKKDDPASAAINASSIFEEEVNSKRVKVVASCTTSSDHLHIYHDVTISITIDGKDYWEKSWSAKKERRVF